MKECFDTLYLKLTEGVSVALATVFMSKGSSPRGVGAVLAADASGLIYGTVGGGRGEAMILDASQEVLRTRNSRIVHITMNNESAAEEGMICGGEIAVFVEPIFPSADMLVFFERVIKDATAQRGVFIRSLKRQGDSIPSFYSNGVFGGTFLSVDVEKKLTASNLAEKSSSFLLKVADQEYLVTPLTLPYRILIAGGGHVALPTVQIAALAGFEVHVMDDRAEFSQSERFPWAASVRTVPEFTDCFVDLSPDKRTCIVIVTRGHKHDGTVLLQALATKAGYIGMIGSVKKRNILYAELRKQGVNEAFLQAVHCPVGLRIHAETPEEIAISIVGECIAFKRGVAF